MSLGLDKGLSLGLRQFASLHTCELPSGGSAMHADMFRMKCEDGVRIIHSIMIFPADLRCKRGVRIIHGCGLYMGNYGI